MKMERDLYIVRGEGETSYVNNSRLQQKALLETKPLTEKAVREVYAALLQPNVVICDLGCSLGDNTLLFISTVIKEISFHRDDFGGNPTELQFFLNDLPGNDFNTIFQSLERFKESMVVDCKGDTVPSFYISGLPGSYYKRLFPRQSVHLFHSSYSLHWRSRLPDELEGKKRKYLNEGNIYIANTTPPSVVKLYQEQFQKDLLLFLRLRYEELALRGLMELTFLGRKNEDVYNGDLNHLYGLIAQSVQSLVEEGLVAKQADLFDISYIELLEYNWDPYDDSEDDDVKDSVQSGVNVAKCIRAVMEPLFASHFGASVIDEMFKKYAYNVAQHLKRENTKYSVIVMSLKRR